MMLNAFSVADAEREGEALNGHVETTSDPNGTTCMRGKELGAVAGARKW